MYLSYPNSKKIICRVVQCHCKVGYTVECVYIMVSFQPRFLTVLGYSGCFRLCIYFTLWEFLGGLYREVAILHIIIQVAVKKCYNVSRYAKIAI